jgi:Icc-related predicted phosphoesterase
MKFLIYSDLHLEQRPFTATAEDGRRVDSEVDLVILAGDIHEGTQGLEWARREFPDKRIVYVAGNHEFYRQDWNRHIDSMRESARKLEVDYLERDAIEIDGVQFLGCTLWTDFELDGKTTALAAIEAARRKVSDYRAIDVRQPPAGEHLGDAKLFPELTRFRHEDSVAWLLEAFDQTDPRTTIVITHHAPLPNSIPLQHQGHDLRAAYASDLSRLMGKAALWIHGHIHHSVDYISNGTRVISNPRGRKLKSGEFENPRFTPSGFWRL